MAGGIPVPTDNLRPMVMFKQAMEQVLHQGKWMHFFPEGSMWFYYPDIRPLKKAVFKYAVEFDRPILPITLSFRPRKGLWKLLGKSPLVDLNIGDPIFHDKSLPKLQSVKKMQQDAYLEQNSTQARYGGVSFHEQSHGESFLALAMNRFEGNGLYILDEPESALSPQRLMSLLVVIDELVKNNSQFIIATHSPILMAYPNADILEFSEQGIHKVGYRKTEHYKITKQFIDMPERMVKYLLSD